MSEPGHAFDFTIKAVYSDSSLWLEKAGGHKSPPFSPEVRTVVLLGKSTLGGQMNAT